MARALAIPAQAGIFSSVQKVDTFKNTVSQKSRTFTVGVPMVLIHNWTTGKTYGQTETLLHEDKSQTDLNYGIYFKEHNGRFFHKHKKLIRSFYSGHAINKSSNGVVASKDQKATYVWSYENDASKSSSFGKALRTFHKDLGLRVSFNPEIPKKEDLGYMKLEAQVDIPEAYTKQLIVSTDTRVFAETMAKNAITLISKYFAEGDKDQLCLNDDDVAFNGTTSCKEMLSNETIRALGKIKNLLVQMKAAKDAAQFTALHALMGKEVVKNQFILNTLFAMDANCELSYQLKIEGQRVNRILKSVPANPSCR